jgi:hypothetical protein
MHRAGECTWCVKCLLYGAGLCAFAIVLWAWNPWLLLHSQTNWTIKQIEEITDDEIRKDATQGEGESFLDRHQIAYSVFDGQDPRYQPMGTDVADAGKEVGLLPAARPMNPFWCRAL